MNEKKRGFTLVELVIVIAVIAILAAVLVPTFSNVIQSSKTSKDIVLVRNLNLTAMALEKQEGKPTTVTESINQLEKSDLTEEDLNLVARNFELIYDLENNRFMIYDKTVEDFAYYDVNFMPNLTTKAAKANYWRLTDKIETNSTTLKDFSVYLMESYEGPTTIEVNSGIDVGKNTNIAQITYSSEDGKEVVICTNGGTLIINAENDTVHHYGSANIIDVQKVAETSYHENGIATLIKVMKGRIVVSDTPKVKVGGIHVENNDVIVAVKKTTVLPAISFAVTVTTFKVQTTDNSGNKETQSTVTISGETIVTTASENSTAVPVGIATQIEQAERKTVEQAEQLASEVVEPVLDSSFVARIGLTGYESLALAVSSANAGDTIKVIGDDRVSLTGATAEKVLTITKNLTITGLTDEENVPLFTIYGTNNFSSAKNAIVVKGTCTVTISNLKFSEFGNEAATGSYGVVIRSESENVNLTIRNVKINKINRSGLLLQKGTFMVDGCDIDCRKTYGTAQLTKGIEVQNNATGTIQNTTIYGVTDTTSGWTCSGIELYGTSNTTIRNTSVNSMSTGIGPQDNAVATIENCTVNAVTVGSNYAYGINIRNNANITIINTDVVVTSGTKTMGICVYSASGKVFTGEVSLTGGSVSANYAVYLYGAGATGTVTINSGDYDGKIYKFGTNDCIINGGTFVTNYQLGLGTGATAPIMYGGTYSKRYNQYVIAEGYFIKFAQQYVVLPLTQSDDIVAFIGLLGFTNIQSAANSSNNATIKLNKNISGYISFNGKTCTLDLNGYNVTNYTNSGNADTINIYNNSTVTITDTSTGTKGTISAVDGSAIWTGASGEDNSVITIEGGISIVGGTHSIQSSEGPTTINIESAVITGDFDVNTGSILNDNR